MKFLDSNGVAILWSKIKDYVAENAGSGGGTVNWSDVQGKPSDLVTDVVISGSGNAVTNVSFESGTLTLTKGTIEGGGSVEGDYLPLSGGTMSGDIIRANSGDVKRSKINNLEISVYDSVNTTTKSMLGITSDYGVVEVGNKLNDKNVHIDANTGITIKGSGMGIKMNSGGSSSSVWNTNGTTTSLSSYATQSWANGRFLPLSGGYMSNNSSIRIANGAADGDGDRFGTKIDSSGVFIGNFGDPLDTHIEILDTGIKSSLNSPNSTFTTDGGTSEFVKSIFGQFTKENYFTTGDSLTYDFFSIGENRLQLKYSADQEAGYQWHAHYGDGSFVWYRRVLNNLYYIGIVNNMVYFANENGSQVDTSDFSHIRNNYTLRITPNGIDNRAVISSSVTINSSWALDNVDTIFSSHTGVNFLSALIIDLDRANGIATVRYTVQSESTDAGYFNVYVGNNNNIVTRAVSNGTNGKGSFIVTVPYDSYGNADMYYYYGVEFVG